jgi:hypothetical protein
MSKTFLSIEEKEKRLSQRKARIQQQEAILKVKKRKLQLSHQIRIGELAEKAGIHSLDYPTLLGAFLSLSESLNSSQIKEMWSKKGVEFLESKDKMTHTKVLETQGV